MKNSPARTNILKKIADALQQSSPQPFDLLSASHNSLFYPPAENNLAQLFKENFDKQNGHCLFCQNEAIFQEAIQTLFTQKQWQHYYTSESGITQILPHTFSALPSSAIDDFSATITSCDYLVARTGSVFFTSASNSGRVAPIYTPIHIIVGYTTQLVYDIGDGLQALTEQYEQLPSMINLATGPSRTADIEKTLVLGIHGPMEVYCFLINK